MIEFKSVKKGPVIKKNGKREIMRIIKLPIFDFFIQCIQRNIH